MKNILKLIVIACVSGAIGMWAYQNLPIHYFIEEYYQVQNLDPNNEKDTEVLRQNVQQLIQKNIPPRYRPNPDHFQCFKIISEAVFFCSADTYRKMEAFHIRHLLQEVIPNEIGWISIDEAHEKAAKIQAEMQNNKKLIADYSSQLEKLKSQNKKNSANAKKFDKTNELYKKNKALLQKKLDILHTMIANIQNEDIRETYKTRLDQAIMDAQMFDQEYEVFQSKNKTFAEAASRQDELQVQMDTLQNEVKKQSGDISFVEQTLSNPNAVGKVANVEELQLISDPSRQKFESIYRESNMIWFFVVAFMILSNFILRIRTLDLIPFEDATRTEALIN